MPWICAFKQRSCGVPELEQQFDSLCSNIIEACLLIIRKDTPKEIICPPANVFRAICIQVKPKKLFVYPKIGDLLANIHTLSMDLPRDAKRDIYIGVSLACLELFSKNDQLSQEYQSFIHGVTQPLLQISTHPQFPACALTNESTYMLVILSIRHRCTDQPKLIHVLTVLSALIESIQGERQSSKIVVLEAIKDVLPMCLALFEHTATHTELQLSIMDLFLKLFASLQKQISSETVAHVTQTFMGGLSGDRLQRLLDCSGQTGIELINRYVVINWFFKE
jgi:hypothetical protein